MQKFFQYLVLPVFCVALLAGCNDDAKIKKATPPDSDKFARSFIQVLNKKNSDAAEKMIEPTIRAEAKPKLKSLVELLSKDGAPTEVRVIGVRGQQKGDQKLIQLNYQIYFEKSWIAASIALIETPKNRFIFSVRMDPLPAPLEKLNAFKFFGKSIIHYLALLFAMMIPVFILYTLVQCIQLPGNLKWIWVPFIILGFVSFHLDWATGRAFLQPLSFLIFGVSAVKQKYGPFILSISLPIGAIAFFIVQMIKTNKKSASSL